MSVMIPNLNDLQATIISVCLLLLVTMNGCGPVRQTDNDIRQQAEQNEPAPMPVATTLDGEPEISISTLRRELGANSQAEFQKAAGQVVAANLMNSGVENLQPLTGLPLKYLDLTNLNVADLSPLQGMPLEELYLEGTQVCDLSVLQGMPLKILRLEHCPVTDISALANLPLLQLNLFDTKVTNIDAVGQMKLNTLWITETAVTDLTPLQGMNLESLDLEKTAVVDLTPLAGNTSLKRLNIAGSAVTDLTPLAGLSLERLIFNPEKITIGFEMLQQMPTLQQLGPSFDQVQPAAEFWASYAAATNADQTNPTVKQPVE